MAKTVVLFPNNYFSVDVETTGLDFEYDEIIEVSAVHIVDGVAVDAYSSLVQPNQHSYMRMEDVERLGYSCYEDVPKEVRQEFYATHFIDEFITELCGITNEMLLNAPKADKVIPELVNFIGNGKVVGHNVTFDSNFIKSACGQLGIDWENELIDTMRISRRLFPDMPHHRLSDMCEALQIPNDHAHRSESDAMATAQLFEKLREKVIETTTIDDFVQSFVRSKRYSYNYSVKDITATVDEIDDTNPLFGKIVVFTGALSSMTRKDAAQLVVNCGGVPADNLTQKTNFLIVGNAEYIASVKDGKTSKMKKAEKYQAKGADITVLSEKTFLTYIGVPFGGSES